MRSRSSSARIAVASGRRPNRRSLPCAPTGVTSTEGPGTACEVRIGDLFLNTSTPYHLERFRSQGAVSADNGHPFFLPKASGNHAVQAATLRLDLRPTLPPLATQRPRLIRPRARRGPQRHRAPPPREDVHRREHRRRHRRVWSGFGEKAEEKGLIEFFKLTSKITTSNMICFDFDGKIKRYGSPEDILEDFYPVRLAYYQKRKDHLAAELQNIFEKLTNQARFIEMIVDKELVISNRKAAPKRRSLESAVDSDDEPPTKKKSPAQPAVTDFFSKAGPSGAASKPEQRKISKSMKPASPPKPKKGLPKKIADSSDDEMDYDAVPAPPARTAPSRPYQPTPVGCGADDTHRRTGQALASGAGGGPTASNRGGTADAGTDLEHAFVEYARAATLIVEKIPEHAGFASGLAVEQRANLKASILMHSGDLLRAGVIRDVSSPLNPALHFPYYLISIAALYYPPNLRLLPSFTDHPPDGEDILQHLGRLKAILVDRYERYARSPSASPDALPVFKLPREMNTAPPKRQGSQHMQRAAADEAAQWRGYGVERRFRPFPKISKARENGEEEEALEEADQSNGGDFDYLLSRAISSPTKEKIERLLQNASEKEDELLALLKISPKELWNIDLALQRELEIKKDLDANGKKIKRKQTVLKTSKSIGKSRGSDSEDDFQPIKAAKRKAPESKRPKPVAKDDDDDEAPPPKKQLEKLPPQAAPSAEIQALKGKMARTLDKIRSKGSSLTVQDLKRLLFRCAATLISLPKLLHYLVALPFEVSIPSALSSGIEIWTWAIAEKPDIEVGLMGEVLAAWSDIIRQEKGIFSTSLNTHPLAREPRFSFLLFGFETLKSSHLDSYCENILRDSLYSAAYSWFASRPQWSYGANWVQVDADIKVEEKYLLANPDSTDPDIAEKLEAL
ncbi:hypothetical protein DFH09DRAFT_1487200 [Mycena vulgaris]|nr:hypothetical protein DFH09DRAFT_1487200 [Mycena vulgaris]